MAFVKYLPIFTMARHYEHRLIFNRKLLRLVYLVPITISM